MPKALTFRVVFGAFLFLFCSLAVPSAYADEVSVSWNGGTGSWGIATNWTAAAVPNNGGGVTFSVTIGAANSAVSMNVLNDTVDNLTLGAANSLSINAGGSLSLVSGDSFNYGTLTNVFSNGLSNSATLVNSGTLNNEVSTLTNTGKLTNTNTGTLFNAESTLTNTGTLSNAGSLDNADATINNAGKLTNTGTLDNNAGDIANTGKLTNSGTFVNNFGVSNSGKLINTGTLTSSFSLINTGKLTNSGVLTNTPDGFFQNTGTIINSGTITNSGTFTNSGTVRITSPGAFTTTTNYNQTAGSTVVNGTLSATGGATVNIQGGALRGGGTVNAPVLMAGAITAGTAHIPLTFNINGNYEQTGAGVYNELIGNRGNGLLNVSGSATLDPGASLDIDLLGGFDPRNGSSFTIMDYGSESGMFTISDPYFNGGTQQWVISSYDGGGGNDVVLTAESRWQSTVPEAPTWVLLGCGLLALLYFGRKKPASESIKRYVR